MSGRCGAVAQRGGAERRRAERSGQRRECAAVVRCPVHRAGGGRGGTAGSPGPQEGLAGDPRQTPAAGRGPAGRSVRSGRPGHLRSARGISALLGASVPRGRCPRRRGRASAGAGLEVVASGATGVRAARWPRARPAPRDCGALRHLQRCGTGRGGRRAPGRAPAGLLRLCAELTGGSAGCRGCSRWLRAGLWPPGRVPLSCGLGVPPGRLVLGRREQRAALPKTSSDTAPLKGCERRFKESRDSAVNSCTLKAVPSAYIG